MKIIILQDRGKRVGLQSAVSIARNKDWFTAPIADTFGPSAALTEIVNESSPLASQTEALTQVLSDHKDVIFVVSGGQRTSETMHLWARDYGAKVVFVQNSWEWSDDVDSSAKFGFTSYAETLNRLLGENKHTEVIILPGKAATLKTALTENQGVFVTENLHDTTEHFARNAKTLAVIPEHILLMPNERDRYQPLSRLDLTLRLSKQLDMAENRINRITGNDLREAMTLSSDDNFYASRVADIVFGLVQSIYNASPDERQNFEDQQLKVPGRVECTTRYETGGYVFDLSGRAVEEMDQLRLDVKRLRGNNIAV